MDNDFSRGVTYRQANASSHANEVVISTRKHPTAHRQSSATKRMERRKSAPQVVHQRHMPKEPNKFHIPRKNKEQKSLFQFVSTESREYEDMKTILISSYIDTNSSSCFMYSNPRLVHSELLEKEFVEKRKEMKADGRTEKELEESYCFLLTTLTNLPALCEKGLVVGQSRITMLGDPGKGVYLSRYCDLLQMNAFTPGTEGEIIIFKVMKGKVKSFYENMKTVQDPTPRFDSHIAKNASNVTSLTHFRAFELTQQYFYEYSFDELRPRPRQVCPYAVVSFHFKGKDASLPSKPAAPIRSISQLSDRSKETGSFTVWTGDIVKRKLVLFPAALLSSLIPFLPHRLPEKLDVGNLMRFDQLTKLMPSGLLSYDLYSSSKEVVADGCYCSLLEVVDRSCSSVNMTKLLLQLERKRVVLVRPLSEQGFFFLLSSVQMTSLSESGESRKRCLQALFVFREPRDVSGFASHCTSYSHEPQMSNVSVMPRLKEFIPALHHALIKARANPPSNLSAGVELQTREYLSSLSDGSARQYSMTEYDAKVDEEGKLHPPPKHHRVNMDSYMKSYLSNPALYLLPVARAEQVVNSVCGPEQRQETAANSIAGCTNDRKIQQLLDMFWTCKRNAELEVRREGGEALKVPGRKRKMEQETAERALKYFKKSQETGRHEKIPDGENRVPSSPFSFKSLIDILGLKDLREEKSELLEKFTRQLKGLIKVANQSFSAQQEEELKDSSPFGVLATKLGLPANCDIDLRKQEELEDQTGGSISSLEGFSPSSHSGEMNYHGAAGRGGGWFGRKAGANEEKQEWEIPWVLIPITGLSLERYSQGGQNIPMDPRFQHLTMATSITTTTKPARKSPTMSPEHSSHHLVTRYPSPIPSPTASSPQYPSPDPSPPTSPFQCPSPDPSPTSPSQCPSPDDSPPTSPSQCPSPDPSPPPSPSECPSPVPSPASSSAQSLSPVIIPHQTSSQCHSLELNKLSSVESNHSGANEPPSPLTGPKEFPGESSEKEEKHQGKEITEELSILSFMDSSGGPASELRIKASQSPNEQVEGNSGKSSEIWPGEEEKKQRDEEADRCLDIKSEEEEMIIEVANEHREKGDMLESEGGSTPPLSVSSNTACPLRDIDILVDKHLEDFTSDLQLLLQEESGISSFPQLSHTPLNTEASTSQCTLSYTLLPPFSHYVSFFNPCPPVQDYVNALKDSITCMLTKPDESRPGHEADPDRTDADASLAKTISDFVSSFRVASDVAGRNSEEFPAANVEPPISEVPLLSREDRVWQTDETNWRSSPSPQLSSSYQNTYKPETSSEISRTITQNIEEAQDNSAIRTVVCSAEREREGSSAGLNCIVMVPGYSRASDTSAEPPLSEPASSPSPVPSTTHLSSIIHQLNPDVLNKLVEIAKDIKRKSLQFYVHCTEAGDLVCEEVKEHILNLGNVQQSPVDFLHQENSENGLLVIIKNKDIAGHVHEIPGLTALKRHSSVMFVGIDSLDDIRNDSCIELFVSGGLIISDELIFSSDVFTHDRLSALLRLLEQHSSLESVWKWLIHCKTQKKLKKQARFSSHAANILDLLTTYQKRQIIEFLPYHHCDMTDHQSCNLDCFIELQARYTQFRHTIYLTGHPLEMLPTYSSKGIIVTSVEEILQNFSSLVGCQSVRDKQLFVEDLLAPKGLSRPLVHQDSVSSYKRSPSTLPEHIHPISSSSLPLEFPPQPTSTQLFLPQPSNEIVPDSSCKNSLSPTTSRDMKFLQQAIQQLRAQRLEQQQQLKLEQQRLEMQMESSDYRLPIRAESETPHLVNEEPTEPVHLMAGRKTIATNVESVLQQPSTEGPGRQGSPGGDELEEQRESNLVRGVQLHTESWISTKNDSSTYLSSQTSGVTEPSDKTEPPHGRSAEEIDQQAEPETFTAEDVRSRDTQLIQDQPLKAGVNPRSSSTACFTTEKKIPVLTAREFKPALKKQHPQPSLQLPNPSTRQTQMVVPFQQSSMAPFQSQPFHSGPLLRQLHPLGGIGSFVVPAHLRPQVLTPTGTPLVWGFQQTGVDFLKEYYKPGGPAAHVYRGARPGGGF
nr:uncharacterized protein tasora [Nothobranchius furzeri]